MEFYKLAENILDKPQRLPDIKKYQSNYNNEQEKIQAEKDKASAEEDKHLQEQTKIMNWVRENGFGSFISDYNPETGEFTFRGEKSKNSFWLVVNFLKGAGEELGWNANSGRDLPDAIYKSKTNPLGFGLFFD